MSNKSRVDQQYLSKSCDEVLSILSYQLHLFYETHSTFSIYSQLKNDSCWSPIRNIECYFPHNNCTDSILILKIYLKKLFKTAYLIEILRNKIENDMKN